MYESEAEAGVTRGGFVIFRSAAVISGSRWPRGTAGTKYRDGPKPHGIRRTASRHVVVPSRPRRTDVFCDHDISRSDSRALFRLHRRWLLRDVNNGQYRYTGMDDTPYLLRSIYGATSPSTHHQTPPGRYRRCRPLGVDRAGRYSKTNRDLKMLPPIYMRGMRPTISPSSYCTIVLVRNEALVRGALCLCHLRDGFPNPSEQAGKSFGRPTPPSQLSTSARQQHGEVFGGREAREAAIILECEGQTHLLPRDSKRGRVIVHGRPSIVGILAWVSSRRLRSCRYCSPS